MRRSGLFAVLGVGFAALSGCTSAPAVAPLPVGAPQDQAAATLDALFADHACRMTSTDLDQALAGRADLERAVQQMLVLGQMRFHTARPVSTISSHYGACA